MRSTAARSAIRFPVEPMKATLGSLPSPADDDAWAYEIKWDGYRTVVFADGGSVRVQSSSGIDVTAKYPELAPIAESINASRAVLDGEIVIFDADQRPSFELVQRHEQPVVFQAFDVLSIDGTDTVGLPYEHRRTLLAGLLEPTPGWTVPAHRVGGGAELLAATRERGLEGVMAKRLGSTYQVGVRTRSWLKVKNRFAAQVVVGGYSAGQGARSSTFGALLVGRGEPDGRLRFAGGVGSGFSAATLDRLRPRLAALRTDECPFDPPPPAAYRRGATWVRPELVADIELTELTNEGFVRQASFVRLREDG